MTQTPEQEYGTHSERDCIARLKYTWIWRTPRGIEIVLAGTSKTPIWSVMYVGKESYASRLSTALTSLSKYNAECAAAVEDMYAEDLFAARKSAALAQMKTPHTKEYASTLCWCDGDIEVRYALDTDTWRIRYDNTFCGKGKTLKEARKRLHTDASDMYLKFAKDMTHHIQGNPL